MAMATGAENDVHARGYSCNWDKKRSIT